MIFAVAGEVGMQVGACTFDYGEGTDDGVSVVFDGRGVGAGLGAGLVVA